MVPFLVPVLTTKNDLLACNSFLALGKLEYQINEPTVETFVIDSSNVGIIEPTVRHQVRPLTPDVEFVVEFHRLPGTGTVDETRE